MRSEFMAKFESLPTNKISIFFQEFDSSFDNLMKDFKEAYSKEI